MFFSWCLAHFFAQEYTFTLFVQMENQTVPVKYLFFLTVKGEVQCFGGRLILLPYSTVIRQS